MAELANKPFTAMDGLVAMAGTLGSIGMMINQINSLIDVWNNKDLTFGQKLTSTLTSLGMIIPMFTRAFGPESMAKIAAFGNLINGRTAADNAVNPAIKAVRTMSETGKTLETAAAGSAEAAEAAAMNATASAALKKSAAIMAASGASKESIATTLLNAGANKDEAMAILMAAGASEDEAAAALEAALANTTAGGAAVAAGGVFATMAAGIWSAVWPLLLIAATIGAVFAVVSGIKGAVVTPKEHLENLAA